jgi:cold-inducible RNA-binding protein
VVIDSPLSNGGRREHVTVDPAAVHVKSKLEDVGCVRHGEKQMKLFVGSLSFDTRDDDLRTAFAAYGTPISAQVIMDRDTGRSKGFGFVEFASADEAKKAIDGLNGKELQGRSVTVAEARPREPRSGGGGGGGGGRRDRY